MAKKKKEIINTAEKESNGTSRFKDMIAALKRFTDDERTRFMTGVLLLLFAAFLFLSFLSFFMTGAADQSKVDFVPLPQLTVINNDIQNWMGPYGASLSHFFIDKWMGVASFILCFWIGIFGLRLMKVSHANLLHTSIYCALSIIVLSLLFGFIFMCFPTESHIYFGGYHGYYANLLLESRIGRAGAFMVIFVLLLLLMVLVSVRTIGYIRKALTTNPLKGLKLKRNTQPKNNGEETSADNPEENPGNERPENEPDINDAAQAESEQSEVTDEPVEYPVTDNEEDDPAEEYSEAEEEVIDHKESLHTQEIKTDDPEFVVTVNEVEIVSGENAPELYDPTRDLSHYKRPTFDLLKQYDNAPINVDMEEQNANKIRIKETLSTYGIEIESINATVGPTITLYEIIPQAGVRIAKIKTLSDDIALSLKAEGIRIIAPMPGKGTVGIEVPNEVKQIVSMHSVIASKKFQECKFELPIALGKTITNDIFIADLSKLPHVLVAGATGQGKSVGLNAIITSLLYKKHPAELKFVLIDPKKVEFSIYADIEKHFLAKLPDAEEAVVTDVTKVVQTLNSITREMDNRYDLLKKAHVRNIREYNEKFIKRQLNPNNGHKFMPYIVVIVDEFGDLIMTAGKEVELPIARIAQLARAVGIHMIIATQRPSTNIITGIIKANFPARIAFRVMQMVDSRTILDCPGANQLIGRGDMLFTQGGELIRVQCAFVDTPEVEHICKYIGEQNGYPSAFELPEYIAPESEESSNISAGNPKDRDPLFEEAARMIVASQQGSTSSLQRRYGIGYNRAGRLMDQLEAAGIVGPSEGGKPRQVLVMDLASLENRLEAGK